MSQQQPIPVEPGQEYERHDPREGVITRLRVIGGIVPWWDGTEKAQVATVAPDGRLLRPRHIATRLLHADLARRSGYRLVRHADGSAVDGAQQ